MNLATPPPNLTSFYVQEIGAVLFCMVFLFLYRQSRVVYFGLWSIAWLLRFLAAIFGFQLMRTGNMAWLAPYATFEFAFVIVLISAARAGFASEIKDWRTILRMIAILPIFVALVYATGRFAGLVAYHVSHGVVLGFVYIYNFATLRPQQGLGSRIFRFSLLVLGLVFLEHAIVFVILYNAGAAPAWASYLQHESYFDFVLHCVLAFAAMAMWSESQIDRIRESNTELDHLRREVRQKVDLDRLTGLFNQAALARRVEEAAEYQGVGAVCDMDTFKEINDRFGHLAGDEILRHIGNLLQASIRHEDEAYRWGGDEFVIFFRNQYSAVARNRMAAIEQRLQDFRVRGLGVVPISFSWGTAEAWSRPLREALDEADRNMYVLKRSRATK